MSAYEALALSYDALTADIPYGEILRYMNRLLANHRKTPESVLDLACGTGTLSILLAQSGYQVLGADISEDMLAVAWEKASSMEHPPFFICQSMEQLQLPYTVDWIICCLDSLNYITKPDKCRQALRRIWEALSPGGVLIFDINSQKKLQDLDGQIFLDENEDTYCVWRAEYQPESRLCFYGMDIFQRNKDNFWCRSSEEHLEYAYTVEQLTQYLLEAGFLLVEVYGDRSFEPPAPEEQRIYFYAEKG